MLTSFIFNKRNKDKSLPSFFLPPHEMLFPGQWAISAGAFDMMHFEDVFKTQDALIRAPVLCVFIVRESCLASSLV